MTILDQITNYTKKRIEQTKKKTPLEQIKQQALLLPKGDFAFEKKLKKMIFLLFVNAKKHHLPKESSIQISHTYKLLKNMKQPKLIVSLY